jgi:DNA polymerase-3 subunit epsilon
MTTERAGGVTLGRQPSILIDRALDLLAAGPADSQTIVSRVCQLQATAGPLADHLATALLASDDRFRRIDERWELVVIPSGARSAESRDLPRRPVTDRQVQTGKAPLATTPFVVVDVEATGNSAGQGDRIMELAAVRVIGGRAEVVFDSLIDPGRPIAPFVTRLTQITDAMVRRAPRFRDIAPQLAGVLEGHVFVAHNVTFDWRFVSMEMALALGRPLVGKRVCTVKLARKLLPTLRRRSLDHVSNHYGIENHARHRAGGDALATARVLIRLLREAEDAGARTLADLDGILRRATARRRRPRRPSAMPRPIDDDTTA